MSTLIEHLHDQSLLERISTALEKAQGDESDLRIYCTWWTQIGNGSGNQELVVRQGSTPEQALERLQTILTANPGPEHEGGLRLHFFQRGNSKVTYGSWQRKCKPFDDSEPTSEAGIWRRYAGNLEMVIRHMVNGNVAMMNAGAQMMTGGGSIVQAAKPAPPVQANNPSGLAQFAPMLMQMLQAPAPVQAAGQAAAQMAAQGGGAPPPGAPPPTGGEAPPSTQTPPTEGQSVTSGAVTEAQEPAGFIDDGAGAPPMSQDDMEAQLLAMAKKDPVGFRTALESLARKFGLDPQKLIGALETGGS